MTVGNPHIDKEPEFRKETTSPEAVIALDQRRAELLELLTQARDANPTWEGRRNEYASLEGEVQQYNRSQEMLYHQTLAREVEEVPLSLNPETMVRTKDVPPELKERIAAGLPQPIESPLMLEQKLLESSIKLRQKRNDSKERDSYAAELQRVMDALTEWGYSPEAPDDLKEYLSAPQVEVEKMLEMA